MTKQDSTDTDSKGKKNTRYYILSAGKYAGELITRVPVKYLIWLMNNSKELLEIAQAEYERRGFFNLNIEVTAHAVNQASLRLHEQWISSRNFNEGIFNWLARMGLAALRNGTDTGNSRIGYQKMVFVFDTNGFVMPVLKTVMPAKKPRVRSTKIKYKNRRRVGDVKK